METTPTETGYATTEQSEYEQTEKANNIDSEQLQEIMDTLRMNKIELNRNSRMFDELKARIKIMEEEAESDPYQHRYEFAMMIVQVTREINDLDWKYRYTIPKMKWQCYYTVVCLKSGLACVAIFGESPDFLDKSFFAKIQKSGFLENHCISYSLYHKV